MFVCEADTQQTKRLIIKQLAILAHSGSVNVIESWVLIVSRMALSHASEIARHYQTLGLEFGADPAAIKKAYHRLALQWHPDKVMRAARAESARSIFMLHALGKHALHTRWEHMRISSCSGRPRLSEPTCLRT